MLYQITVPATAEFIFLLFIPILIIVEIIALKVGLIVVQAEDRRGIKWVAISVLIQMGVILFIGLPIILILLIGGSEGQYTALVVVIIIFALFIDFNVVNVIHRLGMKRAFIVFIFFLIPFIIVSLIIVYNLNVLGYFS